MADLKILAVLAVRNEEAYLQVCLDYLVRQGIRVALIDNGSEDRTLEIARSYSRDDVVAIDHLPFTGCFDLHAILTRKAELARWIGCDWVIHHDADEIMHTDRPGETLAEGIARVDQEGYEGIDFEEFVFLPEDESCSYAGTDYFRTMHAYYLFRPAGHHWMRAYRYRSGRTNAELGGHRVPLQEGQLYPGLFVKRHYLCLSLHGLRRKYVARRWSPENIAKGWHYNRVGLTRDQLRLPPVSALKRWSVDPFALDRSDPKTTHFWEWDAPKLTRPGSTPRSSSTGPGGSAGPTASPG